MKKFFLASTVLLILSCSKNNTDQTTTSSDSATTDTMTAVPNPAPQTTGVDSTSGNDSANVNTASPAVKRDSAK